MDLTMWIVSLHSCWLWHNFLRLLENYKLCPDVALPRDLVYRHYCHFCHQRDFVIGSRSYFTKVKHYMKPAMISIYLNKQIIFITVDLHFKLLKAFYIIIRSLVFKLSHCLSLKILTCQKKVVLVFFPRHFQCSFRLSES